MHLYKIAIFRWYFGVDYIMQLRSTGLVNSIKTGKQRVHDVTNSAV
jgi:hypothetical protein